MALFALSAVAVDEALSVRRQPEKDKGTSLPDYRIVIEVKMAVRKLNSKFRSPDSISSILVAITEKG